MSIWPLEFQSIRVPGMSAIEGLARDYFGVDPDAANCPDCVRRWAWLSLCRLHSDGDDHACELLDAAIRKAAAQFKRRAN
ncbi:hypothetical protein [Cognatiluteimonas weifangensis]|uniref:hypothetical protein n=1 Tax=Cognatiluteimonas weifangensis TaxID=2303539 RepID=UPI0011C1D142|nr:hypothetical protein [Luteimonas weifangensis]